MNWEIAGWIVAALVGSYLFVNVMFGLLLIAVAGSVVSESTSDD